MSSHTCDICLKTNIPNRRYKCLICENYDLCGLCYDINSESQYHKNTHPMQCILTKTAYGGFLFSFFRNKILFLFFLSIELFYSGESIPYQTIVSLTCPYCSLSGFIPQTFLKHCLEKHSNNNKISRICPICVINQIEGHQIRYLSLVDHIVKEHDQEINDISEDFQHDNDDEGLPLYILAERLFFKEKNRRQYDINSQRHLLSRQIGLRDFRSTCFILNNIY